MKKNSYLLVLLVTFLSISCKKEATESQMSNVNIDPVQLQSLVTKYHLIELTKTQTTALIGNNSVRKFSSLSELESYLKAVGHRKVVKGSGVIMTGSDVAGSTPPTGMQSFASYTTFGGNQHFAQINFSGFVGVDYPTVMKVTWTSGGSAVAYLLNGGPSYGSWSFTQSTGIDSNSDLSVTGTYTEIFSFGGIANLAYNYDFAYDSGHYGGGNIYGTASYTPTSMPHGE